MFTARSSACRVDIGVRYGTAERRSVNEAHAVDDSPALRACTVVRQLRRVGVQTRTLAQESRLEAGRLFDDVHHQPQADSKRALVEVEGRLVQVQLWAMTRPHAEPGHGTRDFLEIPREVLAAAGLFG